MPGDGAGERGFLRQWEPRDEGGASVEGEEEVAMEGFSEGRPVGKGRDLHRRWWGLARRCWHCPVASSMHGRFTREVLTFCFA